MTTLIEVPTKSILFIGEMIFNGAAIGVTIKRKERERERERERKEKIRRSVRIIETMLNRHWKHVRYAQFRHERRQRRSSGSVFADRTEFELSWLAPIVPPFDARNICRVN